MPNLRVKGVAGGGKLKHVSHTSLRQFHRFRLIFGHNFFQT